MRLDYYHVKLFTMCKYAGTRPEGLIFVIGLVDN
jgi:hypothetical protein